VSEYDVIIIGSGIGGLTSGALLAKQGKRVCVLEQHREAGGCTTTFKRQGYEFEVAMHFYAPPPKIFSRVYEELGLDQSLTHLEEPCFFRYLDYHDKTRSVKVPKDPEEACSLVCRLFPQETEAIYNFFNDMGQAYKLFADPMSALDKSKVNLEEFGNRYSKTTEEALSQCSPLLKQALSGLFALFESDIQTLNYGDYLVGLAAYFYSTPCVIKGGSRAMTKVLSELVKSNGGAIFTSKEVVKLHYDKNTISGVEVVGEAELYQADNYVAAVSPKMVVNSFLSDYPESHPWKKNLSSPDTGASSSSVYLGLEPGYTLPSDFPLLNLCQVDLQCVPDNAPDYLEAVRNASLMIMNYSARPDFFSTSQGASVCVIYNDFISNWRGLTRQDYKERKKLCTDEIISKMEHFIPGFSLKVKHCSMSTPLTIERYTKCPDGAYRGYVLDTKNSTPNRPNTRTPFKNLFLAGSWLRTGTGICGALLSGHRCARTVLSSSR
jgi:phytoene dehydrogenase-like protein